MGNRRFAQLATSDDEEDDSPSPPPPPPSKQHQTRGLSATVPNTEDDSPPPRNKRNKITNEDEKDEIDEMEEEEEMESKRGRRKSRTVDEEDEEETDSEEEEVPQDAKPVGESVRVSGKGKGRRTHYEAFEFDGTQYNLEDPVLLVPEDKGQKPYVAIIKDVTVKDGSMMVTGQWFYRPEEAGKLGGGSWQSRDTRELFYSFHRDDVPAESVMHKCVVHFVPIDKQLPVRKQNPGFIVQKVYDTVQKKLWNLTDKDYEDSKQHEIDLLVAKTNSRLGKVLPDLEIADIPVDQEEQAKKRTLKKRSVPPIDVTRDEETIARSDIKAETPGSCLANASAYHAILATFDGLTGDSVRDKWLERLLQGVEYVCSPADTVKGEDETKISDDADDNEKDNKDVEKSVGKTGDSFLWPNAAVPPVTALEQAAYETLYSDFQKYNQKMRQLLFNLKNNDLLARRLLNGELQPSKILNMSSSELKEGLTAEETTTKDTDESEPMQMTDARCSRCSEMKVGVREIIQTGNGDRYQLECIACGHTWYGSRDEVSTLTTTDAPSSAKSVGTAPLATAKFATVEKLLSPRESDKSIDDILKKSTKAYIPVLESQKSSAKSKNDDNTESTTKKAE